MLALRRWHKPESRARRLWAGSVPTVGLWRAVCSGLEPWGCSIPVPILLTHPRHARRFAQRSRGGFCPGTPTRLPHSPQIPARLPGCSPTLPGGRRLDPSPRAAASPWHGGGRRFETAGMAAAPPGLGRGVRAAFGPAACQRGPGRARVPAARSLPRSPRRLAARHRAGGSLLSHDLSGS